MGSGGDNYPCVVCGSSNLHSFERRECEESHGEQAVKYAEHREKMARTDRESADYWRKRAAEAESALRKQDGPSELDTMMAARDVAAGCRLTRSMKGDRARWNAILTAIDLAVVELGGDAVTYP